MAGHVVVEDMGWEGADWQGSPARAFATSVGDEKPQRGSGTGQRLMGLDWLEVAVDRRRE